MGRVALWEKAKQIKLADICGLTRYSRRGAGDLGLSMFMRLGEEEILY